MHKRQGSGGVMDAYHPLIERAAKLSFELTDEKKAELMTLASKLTASGKGLLAADESPGTIGKRLMAAGLTNVEETRRAYRELLFLPPDVGDHLSGVIMHSETLEQQTRDGRAFVEVLTEKGVLVGVKSDLGLDPLDFSPKETRTKVSLVQGLDDLLERSQQYFEKGARFAKWRAVIRIDEAASLPTRAAIMLNAAELAHYAAVSQAAGLVPIVEPEILIEGPHSAYVFARVTEAVLAEVYYTLAQAKVFLEGTLLKPQMIVAGVDAPAEAKLNPEDTAAQTLEVLRRRVPPAVPGIMFLSGGQTEEEATTNLNAINRLANSSSRHPWHLSFSFGRSLQASVLHVWEGKNENAAEAITVAGELAKANSLAQRGEYEGPHPTRLASRSLHETHRGWSGQTQKSNHDEDPAEKTLDDSNTSAST